VGCNFALNRIPGSARIPVVSEGAVSPPAEVRERYRLARKQVEGLTVKQRGWRQDVLRVIQSLGKTEFTTTDAYIFERELEQLHPGNRNIKVNPVNKKTGQEFASNFRNFRLRFTSTRQVATGT
jgi:hypothetical protein